MGSPEEDILTVLWAFGPSIPRVPLSTFMDFLAPPQPVFDIDATMTMLQSMPQGVLSPSGRWKYFDEQPKDQSGEEAHVFEPMADVFKNVVHAIIANSNQRLNTDDCLVDFLLNQTMEPRSYNRNNASRPDGCLLLKDRLDGKVTSWADVVLSCEYQQKGGDDELDDNVRKCFWSMQHVMRDDPCRRATFGMTIENTSTRVWFCCRSLAVVSHSFNFIDDPKALVKLFAAFAFADRTSLGFDPTITRVLADPKQLIITVHPHHDKTSPRRFRTQKVISLFGAERLRSKGTRVFEAVEIDELGRDKGAVVVLKDIWARQDRTREGLILAQLYDEANEEDKKLVAKHFLAAACHGDVWVEPDVLDDTQNGLLRGLELSPDNLFELQYHGGAGSPSFDSTSRFYISRQNPPIEHKTHYRIVFEERGITIDCIPSLSQVVKVLAETVTALQLLRKLGWVHRDVSIGNILSCNGRAKLVDLEYAKKMGDMTTDGKPVGTMEFMSVEVAAEIFLFPPPPPPLSPTMDFAERRRRFKERMLEETAILPFGHNHLHDLESLWWVAVWFVFYHEFHVTPLSNEVPGNLLHVQRQITLAQTLFPPTTGVASRRDGFEHSFGALCQKLPSSKQEFCSYLDFLRCDLMRNYWNVEATLPNSIDLMACNDKIYENFKKAFTWLQEQEISLVYIPTIYNELRRH